MTSEFSVINITEDQHVHEDNNYDNEEEAEISVQKVLRSILHRNGSQYHAIGKFAVVFNNNGIQEKLLKMRTM